MELWLCIVLMLFTGAAGGFGGWLAFRPKIKNPVDPRVLETVSPVAVVRREVTESLDYHSKSIRTLKNIDLGRGYGKLKGDDYCYWTKNGYQIIVHFHAKDQYEIIIRTTKNNGDW